MKKKICYIIVLLILILTGFKATTKKDSLLNCLKIYPEDSLPKVYNELFPKILNISVDSAYKYANKALELAQKYGNLKEVMFAYDGIGLCFYNKGNMDKALDYWSKSLDIAKKRNDQKMVAYFLNEIGVVYKKQGKYQKAIEYYQQSYDMQEKLKNKLQMGQALANIGNIYYTFGIDMDKALEYYNQALDLFEKAGRKNFAAMIMSSIANIYKKNKDYTKSLEYFGRSLKLYEEENLPLWVAQAHADIGSVYIESGNFNLALQYNLKALNVFKQIGNNIYIAQSYGYIGDIYYRMGNYTSALYYLKLSLDLRKQMNSKKEMLDVYKLISKVYSSMGDYKKAYDNFQEYSSLKDSTMGEDYMKQIQEMEAKYESDKKDGEIKLQKAEISKKEIEAKRKNFVIYSFAFFILVILFFSFMIYKQYSEKKKANILLAEQNDEIKKQRDQIFQQKKEITDSIHYASRIQRAVLPPSKILVDNDLEHFILYKPRDIVSGDFYWMNQKDNKIIIAAADCTGHGVPGAFMSMLGMAFLNEIVSKGDFDNASQILDQLRQYVVKSLHQTGKDEDTKDGMDISLLILNKDNNQVQFSGAFNSLYLIRNGELIEANADRMPIGYHDKMDVHFTNHIIDIQKADTIYIYSDGYADQFGGVNGKKFMSKRFKDLLLSFQKNSMEEQKAILDRTIVEWRGEFDQIDDIMVIGLRV